MLQAFAAPGVHLAGDDKFLETLRPTIHVEAVQQFQQSRSPQLQRPVAMGVVLAHQQRQLLAFARRLEALVHRLDQFQPALLVSDMSWPFFFRGKAFAQVMQQTGPAHAQGLLVQGGLFEHREGVDTAVDLRVMGLRLWHAEQRIELWHQLLEGAAIAQHLDEYLRLIFHQRPGDFLPAALGGQRLQLAGFAECVHQFDGFRGHAKAHAGIARGKPGDAQHAQGIFGERRGYMAQDAGFKILLAVIRIADVALVIFGHGIDGQVAADEVFFKGNLGAGVEGEAAIAASALALGARQGVFLAAFGVQEYREIRPDRAITQGLHLFRRGTDHDPVDITDRPAEQAVAYGAADFVDLHVEPPLMPQDNLSGSNGGHARGALPPGPGGRSPLRRARLWGARGGFSSPDRPAGFPGGCQSPRGGAGA
uniref:Uncharacterized protein n=1 Tax=Pseudomonas fluorescens TaxID=294 RepID=A0A5E6W3R3_PSEFL|nr:hypothetical protein PS652_04447 [Pseudomonas fluorescens]